MNKYSVTKIFFIITLFFIIQSNLIAKPCIKVMGYLMGTSALTHDWDALTHVIDSFAYISNSSGGLNTWILRTTSLTSLAHANNTRCFFSIGGANDPGKSNWSAVLASPSARTNLVNNIYNYCVNYNYDGVDIDWEFPGASDKANFTAFMTELYNKLKAGPKKGYDGQPLELSFYTSPGWYDAGYDFLALANVVDYCIQSGYDWGNPANAPLRNPGVTIESAAHYIFEASIDGFGKNVVARGFPANKFILGLPMYSTPGHVWWKDVTGSGTYNATYAEGNYSGQWFTDAQGYTDKIKYVKQYSRPGIAIWEISQCGSKTDLWTAIKNTSCQTFPTFTPTPVNVCGVFEDFEQGLNPNSQVVADTSKGASGSIYRENTAGFPSGWGARCIFNAGQSGSWGVNFNFASYYDNGLGYYDATTCFTPTHLEFDIKVPAGILWGSFLRESTLNGGDAEQYIGPSGTGTGNWEHIQLPLAQFSLSPWSGNQNGNKKIDLKAVRFIGILFSPPAQGTFYIDNIKFTNPPPTPTPTNTFTFTRTYTFTSTDTFTRTFTSTNTNTHTPTNTPTFTQPSTNTFTNTSTFTRTNTNTSTVTNTSTNTLLPTNTFTNTSTVTSTSTRTHTLTSTFTSTYTNTRTSTSTFTITNSPTNTNTPTQTITGSQPPTWTFTNTFTLTDTSTNTTIPTNTFTRTPTNTNTSTRTFTLTFTITNTSTNTNTPTQTITGTQPSTWTFTNTYTLTDTSTFTQTFTSTNTLTQIPTNTATATQVATGIVIDDFEEGDFDITDWGGLWTQWAAANCYVTRAVTNDAGLGNYAGKISADITGNGWPSVAVTFDLNASGTEMDLSGTQGIKLYMKGNKGSGTPVDFLIQLVSTNITDYSYWRFNYTPAENWVLVEIPWSLFSAPGWGQGAGLQIGDVLQHIRAVNFAIADTTGGSASNTGNNWYIDHIELMIGETSTKTPTATGTPTSTATQTWTQLLTLTPTNTFVFTSTQTFTQIITQTPTPSLTEVDNLEIVKETPVIIYPNPVTNKNNAIKIKFAITKSANKFKIKLYTSSLRLIKDTEIDYLMKAGINEINLNCELINNLARGTYYYIIEVKDNKGKIAKSKVEKLIKL